MKCFLAINAVFWIVLCVTVCVRNSNFAAAALGVGAIVTIAATEAHRARVEALLKRAVRMLRGAKK